MHSALIRGKAFRREGVIRFGCPDVARNTDPAPKDYGTGIASFAKNKNGKWTFTKYCYEPEFKGGNFGTETCFQR